MGSFNKLKDILEQKDSFLLIGHERPDGDCIGSLVALGQGLKDRGKKVTLVCKDPVPEVFKFLDGVEKVQSDFLLGDHEAVILLDNGDFQRIGFSKRLSQIIKKLPLINIDHHPKNDIWIKASINLADETASSTCEILYKIFLGLKINITPKIATALLAGLFNDTGGFRHSNTTSEVLNVTSELLKSGAKLKNISKNLFNLHSTASMRLWGVALNRLRHNKRLGIAYSVLLQKDIKNANASEEEVSGLVNLINNIPEAKIALLLYETADGKIKGSLRTESSKTDVSKLAHYLLGGGHKKAAGFVLEGKIERNGGNWQVI